MSAGALDALDRLYRVLHDGRFYSDYDKASELLGELRDARADYAELIERSNDALRALNIAIEFNGLIKNTKALKADAIALASILARARGVE